ncbi:MAG TPA: glycosyltransferase [Pirellulales bacterium]|nr:glycosyltransferase [Pirellulales bacterium]
MNVAIVSAPPNQCLCDKLAWVADGFRQAGHDVRRCHTLTEVRAADRECDLLVFDHKNAGVCHNSLVEMAPWRRAKWVQWWRDLIALEPMAPLCEQPYMQSFLRLMQAMDLVLVKERSLLKGYAELGIHARWFDQACPEEMPPCEHHERPEWDVLVLGSTYPQRRQDARALADAGFRVLWAGLANSIPPGVEGHPWVHPLELPELVSRCGVVLGVDWRCDLPGYTSDRTYLAAGMGACYIARSIDYGIDSAPSTPAGEFASWIYFDQGSLVSAVRTALADRDERERRGLAAREKIMAAHTYKHRAEQLLALIDKELQPCGVLQSS